MKYVQQFAEMSLQERTEAIAKILSDRAVALLSEKIELADDQEDEPKYTFSSTDATKHSEGKIHALDAPLDSISADLNIPAGFLDDKSKYSKTGLITGTDGSKHTIYSREGIARIRPVGDTTDEHTDALKRYIGVKESVMTESTEEDEACRS